ncbi:MAG TPA: urea ABC transporter permease subunit UrtB, partial [Pseudomonas oleovorans]|nr:urea ABC transporter permease subunit UrtB [Pseudomonas oleovorans]
MPTALTRILLSLLLLLPLAATAGEADDFAAANASKQAKLLQGWAAAPTIERMPLLQALQQGRVASDADKRAFIDQDGTWQAAGGEGEANGTPRKLRLNNRLRGLIGVAVASHQLLDDAAAVRLEAARQLQRNTPPTLLPLLESRLSIEADDAVQDAITLALANLQLSDADPAVRLAAVKRLGQTGDP